MVLGMPTIKAAEKWARQSAKRSERNKEVKTRLKTLFKKATSDPELAGGVESAFDKAASKGIIHPNKAARKKSRLAKALRNANAPAKATKSRATSARKKAPKKSS